MVEEPGFMPKHRVSDSPWKQGNVLDKKEMFLIKRACWISRLFYFDLIVFGNIGKKFFYPVVYLLLQIINCKKVLHFVIHGSLYECKLHFLIKQVP